jgi:dihydroorotase
MAPPPARRARSGTTEPPRAAIASILAGRAFVNGRLQSVEVAIDEDGWIRSIGKVRVGARRHDVGEAVILPAATDLHVHLRDPGGPTDAETIASGTVAAAVGGVGLVGEMPNTVPPVTDAATLREKAARVPGRAAVDVLLYASPTVARARAALAREAGAFKLYLSPTTGIATPPPLDSVPSLLAELASLGLPLSVHAEDPERFGAPDPARDLREWDAHRPLRAERAAVELLEQAPASLRLHVAHVTSASEIPALRAHGASFEVTPHHLLLSEPSSLAARGKVNPPLRSEAERAALWDAFRQGTVPCVASDHAPHSSSEKELPFERAPSGVPGVETMLPLLLARVRSGELELPTLVRAACDRPARWFGQPIGRLAVGHRAHLIVVDFRARTTLEGRRLHSACGWTPFEGWEAIFPREHYRDGVRIVRDGEYVGEATGRVVRPEFAPAGRDA